MSDQQRRINAAFPNGVPPASGPTPGVRTLMIPNDGPYGQQSYLPLGPGPNTRGVPSWDPTRPLSESTPNNRGAIREIHAGQSLAVADARTTPNKVAEDINVVLGISTIGVEQNSVTDEPVDSLVRACVRWGIGSAEFQAEVDWLNGTVLTVPAEQIYVSARYDRFFVGGSDPATPPVFCLSAGFAYGRAGKNSNPSRLTERVTVLTPGDSQELRIPNFATSFTVVLVEPSTSAKVEVYGFGRAFANQINIVSPMSNVGQFDVEDAFPLRNGAKFVRITNTNSGSQSLYAYVIFGLSL